jgi:hypothetical protein
MKGKHVVLFPIEVPEGGLCYDYKTFIGCEHFDNDGGHPHCALGFWNFIDMKTREYCKAEKCLALKEQN